MKNNRFLCYAKNEFSSLYKSNRRLRVIELSGLYHLDSFAFWILTSLPCQREKKKHSGILQDSLLLVQSSKKTGTHIPFGDITKKMPPKTRKAATASSSNATGIPDKTAVVAGKKPIDVSDKISEDGNSPDHRPKIVVDEDEEDMEVSEMSDEGGREVHAPNKDEQRALYAVGGGGYNALKTFQGQVYSGMAIGGSHTWNYDQGVWNETKVEPDRWEIDYATTKRRARKAPKGSGVPIGTQYHWFIVGHQVRSLFGVKLILKRYYG